MNLKRGYRQFFSKSPEGQEFVKTLHKLIDGAHTAAEKDGDKARDHTQRAAGIREVIKHINSVTAKGKNEPTE